MALQLGTADRTPAGIDALPVTGTLPAGLRGVLRQHLPHPLLPASVGCGHLLSRSYEAGVRLSGGTARWHRSRSAPAGLLPRLPRTAEVRAAGPAVSVAHPVADPFGTELHTVAVHPGLPFAEHLVGTPDGVEQRSEPFPLDGAPLVHAVAVTEHWVLVLDLPVTARESAALVTGFPWRWTPGRPARIGLLPRAGGGPVRWLPIEPCFVFHTIGAYEIGERTILLDAVRHERAFSPAGPAGPPALWRWELDLATGTVVETKLADDAVELPTGSGGTLPGAVWTVEQLPGATGPGAGPALLRHQLSAGGGTRTARWEPGPGRLVGQPVLAGDWLLVAVDDALADRTELVVLDPTTLTPVASVPLPVRLPAGAHGDWLAL